MPDGHHLPRRRVQGGAPGRWPGNGEDRRPNHAETQCVIGPPLCEVLIGQLVLEAVDMVADCTNRTLMPRTPDYPLLKMK